MAPSNASGLPAPPALCKAGDTVVFSCPLAGRTKVVSLCAGTSTGQVGAFHYVYGRPSKPELVFPSKDEHEASPFRSTHLMYGGATGGTAYSFVHGGYKYIVYSISGTAYRDGGVLVQKMGSAHAVSDMKCRQGKITESEDDAIVDATMKWGADPDIEAKGLPRVGK